MTLYSKMSQIVRRTKAARSFPNDFLVHDRNFLQTTKKGDVFLWAPYLSGTHIWGLSGSLDHSVQIGRTSVSISRMVKDYASSIPYTFVIEVTSDGGKTGKVRTRALDYVHPWDLFEESSKIHRDNVMRANRNAIQKKADEYNV